MKIKIQITCLAMFLITSLAAAHDHDNLFDLCSVTGCVACEPEQMKIMILVFIGVWLQPTYRNYSLAESGILASFLVKEVKDHINKELGSIIRILLVTSKADQLKEALLLHRLSMKEKQKLS